MPIIVPSRKEMMRHIQKRLEERNKNKGTANESDLKLVYDFSERLVKSFGGFVQGVILFGSIARKSNKDESDFDILVLVDDTTWEPTPELIGTWRIGSGKILADLGAMEKLHVTTIGVVQFWDAVRVSDPVILNIIRDGKPIIETGFFKPLKKILELGGFKTSKEAVLMRLSRSKALEAGVGNHMLMAFDDIYWSVMDSTQAALMSMELYPSSPKEMIETITRIKSKLNIQQPEINFVKKLIDITKEIEHKKKSSITMEELKRYNSLVERYNEKMYKVSQKNLSKM